MLCPLHQGLRGPDAPCRLPTPTPTTRKQGDKLPGSSRVDFIWFAQLSAAFVFHNTLGWAGSPCGHQRCRWQQPQGSIRAQGPSPASYQPAARSPGDSQKGLLPGPGVTSPSATRAAPEQPGVPAPRVTGRAQVQVVPGPTAGRLLASGRIQGAQPPPVMNERVQKSFVG